MAVCAAEYQLVISKKQKQLTVKQGENIIKTFRIATGKGGKGTRIKQGDSKTPIGVYHIVDFKKDSKFHYFMQIDYPNLIDAWYGYKNAIISAEEFKKIASSYKKREIPPQNTHLGGYIGIHGLGPTNEQKLVIHHEANWTEGCIALTNEEINELRQYVKIGTQVVIRE